MASLFIPLLKIIALKLVACLILRNSAGSFKGLIPILGEAIQLQFDNEGRVTLPSYLTNQIGITNQGCFVGKGLVFEIWNPDNFEKYLKSARLIAQENRSILKNKKDNSGE